MLKEKTPNEAKGGLGIASLSSELNSASAAAVASSSFPHSGSRKPRSLGLTVFSFVLLSTLLLAAARPAQAQTETILHNFTCGTTDGCFPEAGVVLDTEDNLDGTLLLGCELYRRSGEWYGPLRRGPRFEGESLWHNIWRRRLQLGHRVQGDPDWQGNGSPQFRSKWQGRFLSCRGRDSGFER